MLNLIIDFSNDDIFVIIKFKICRWQDMDKLTAGFPGLPFLLSSPPLPWGKNPATSFSQSSPSNVQLLQINLTREQGRKKLWGNEVPVNSVNIGIWAEVRGPARGRGGGFLLLQCRATEDRHKGERIQADNTKPQGIKLHQPQRSSLGGKCRRRLSLGGSQYIIKYIKDRFMSPLLAFTGYLCGTNAKDSVVTAPVTAHTAPVLLLPRKLCLAKRHSKILNGFTQNSSHLGLLE